MITLFDINVLWRNRHWKKTHKTLKQKTKRMQHSVRKTRKLSNNETKIKQWSLPYYLPQQTCEALPHSWEVMTTGIISIEWHFCAAESNAMVFDPIIKLWTRSCGNSRRLFKLSKYLDLASEDKTSITAGCTCKVFRNRLTKVFFLTLFKKK